MRVFIAIELRAEVKAAIVALQTAVRLSGAEVSWPRPENIHLTLTFLGEIETDALGRVEQGGREAAQGVPPFEWSLSGTGVFPNHRAPRILWVGLGGQVEQARQLHRRLD